MQICDRIKYIWYDINMEEKIYFMEDFMFGFGKGSVEIATPVSGKIIDITQVKDEVFAGKMLGDGFAVEPDEDIICAPVDGIIRTIPETKHAIVIECSGVHLLIHAGIDTVQLAGEGFETFVHTGDSVKKGEKLLKMDRAFIEKSGKLTTVIIAVTNFDDVAKKMEKNLDNASGVLDITLK